MNKIWIGMIAISIIIGITKGLPKEMVETIFDGAVLATQNSINIIGMICLWSGIMKVANECGLVKKFSKIVKPFIKILFPRLKEDDEVKGNIALNLTANLLGLGNISTSLGLAAMKNLQEKNPKKETLSDEMMMLIVINTASIQLIPSSIIALRAMNGSENPVKIVLPTLISSLLSVIVGVIMVKANNKNRRENENH